MRQGIGTGLSLCSTALILNTRSTHHHCCSAGFISTYWRMRSPCFIWQACCAGVNAEHTAAGLWLEWETLCILVSAFSSLCLNLQLFWHMHDIFFVSTTVLMFIPLPLYLLSRHWSAVIFLSSPNDCLNELWLHFF